MAAVIEAAARLLERGHQVVPVAPRSKGCKDDGWLKLVFKAEDFQPGDNIGIRSVNGDVIIDLDSPEAVALADAFLPPTACIWGRPSKPKAKRMYRCDGFDKTVALKSDANKSLVEIRVNHQDLAPPSIHPEGEQLIWYSQGEPASVEAAELRHAVRLLATAALIAPHYPAAGARHEWCLQLAGLLRRLDLAEPDAVKVIEAAARLAEDMKLDDRLREVRSTYAQEEGVAALKQPKALVEAFKRLWPKARETRNGFQTTKDGGTVTPNRANVELALQKLGVTARFDAFALKHYIVRDKQPTVFSDRDLVELRMAMDQQFAFLPTKELLTDVIQNAGWQNEFHPVRDYLNGLKWDETPRLDAWLRTYGGAKDTTVIRAQSRIVLIAAVRRVRHPGCKFDEIPILISKQGLGKSQAIKALCPNAEWFSDDLPLGVDAKQVIERTGGKWIIEAAEMTGFNTKEAEKLKAFLSRGVDGPVRLAYAHVAGECPRQFVLVGTTNNRQFLKDKSGNRRFWPIEVEKFDLAALRRDRDQLWAEAAQREAAGESIRLDESLWLEAAKEQERATVDDPWAETITALFSSDKPEFMEDVIPVKDIWEALGIGISQRTTADAARLSEIMQALGFEKYTQRVEGKPMKVWKRKARQERLPQ